MDTKEDSSIQTIAEVPGVDLPVVDTPEVGRTLTFAKELAADGKTSTPILKMSEGTERDARDTTEDLDDRLAETRREVADLKDLLDIYKKQLHDVQKLQGDLAQQQQDTTVPADETRTSFKLPLPAKYEGDLDFNDYLAQFEALAGEHGWTTAKKGVILLGRLKGRALEVAVKGKELDYASLITRLRSHFSPDHEDMFAQQLQALQKKPKQTWEDLAFEVRRLTIKAYKDVASTTQERLAAQAFINAIPEDDIRNKVRDTHPKTVAETLQQIRQVEADIAIEQQRKSQDKTSEKVRESARTLKMEDTGEKLKVLEEQMKTLLARVEEKGVGEKKKEADEARRTARGAGRGRPAWGRGRGRGIRARGCYLCGGPHFLRECPQKLAWMQQQAATAYPTNTPSQFTPAYGGTYNTNQTTSTNQPARLN